MDTGSSGRVNLCEICREMPPKEMLMGLHRQAVHCFLHGVQLVLFLVKFMSVQDVILSIIHRLEHSQNMLLRDFVSWFSYLVGVSGPPRTL